MYQKISTRMHQNLKNLSKSYLAWATRVLEVAYSTYFSNFLLGMYGLGFSLNQSKNGKKFLSIKFGIYNLSIVKLYTIYIAIFANFLLCMSLLYYLVTKSYEIFKIYLQSKVTFRYDTFIYEYATDLKSLEINSFI